MDELRKIGLKKYESNIYSALLVMKVGNALEISDKSKVPITAVYPNLRSLQKKNLINEIKGDPSLFRVIEPNKGIANEAEKRKKEIEEDKSKAIEFADKLYQEKHEEERIKDVVSITYGKDPSKFFYDEAFTKVKSSLYIMGWRFEKVSDKYTLLREIKKIIKHKIDVRIILTGSRKKVNELVDDYKEAGVKIKYLPLDNFSIAIIDKDICKITLKDRDKEKTNMVVGDKNLSKAMNDYFLDCWKKAEEI